jgi:hypothetical protein
MKKYFKKCCIWMLLLTPISGYAQIYNKAGEVKFEVMHYSGKDTAKSDIRLVLHGILWNIHEPDGNGGIKIFTQQNNWAINWVSHPTYNPNPKFSTGVIERDSWIFLHPPRHDQYEILEYCPFPQIRFPLYAGKSWNYDLEVGENYYKAIKKDLKGKKATIVKSKYTVVSKRSWYYPFLKKNISCYEINAIGQTDFGNTRLQAYFSETYGFVYLNYETLNDDRFVFTNTFRTIKDSSFQFKTW